MSRRYRRNSRRPARSSATAAPANNHSAASQWREYFFYLFTLCATRTNYAREGIVSMGLRTTGWEQLIPVADGVLRNCHEELSEASAEQISRARNALSDAADAASPGQTTPRAVQRGALRLANTLLRCADTSDSCRERVIDLLLGDPEISAVLFASEKQPQFNYLLQNRPMTRHN